MRILTTILGIGGLPILASCTAGSTLASSAITLVCFSLISLVCFWKQFKKYTSWNAVNFKESSLCQPFCGCVEVLRLNVVERFVWRGKQNSPIMQFDIRATQSVNKKYPVPALSFAWPYKLVVHFPEWHYKTVDVFIYLSLKILTGANETQEGGEGGGREGRGNWPSSLPRYYRALDLKTRMTTSTRFNLKVFSRIFEKY